MVDKTPLDELRAVALGCTQCNLHCTRTQVVFDRGNPDGPLMIIGEAPGKDEDKQGQPFVGRAGQLLGQLLISARIPEDQVYMANVLKCRPPNNRFPEDGEEPEKCRGYLLKQIKEVNPRAVLLTGKQALKYVLLHGTTEEATPLNPWINKQFRRKDLFGDLRFMVVYHPAYLMRRNDEIDMEAWISSVAGIWSYVTHKENGTAPPAMPFRDIRPAPIVPRQGRNLFAEGRGPAL